MVVVEEEKYKRSWPRHSRHLFASPKPSADRPALQALHRRPKTSKPSGYRFEHVVSLLLVKSKLIVSVIFGHCPNELLICTLAGSLSSTFDIIVCGALPSPTDSDRQHSFIFVLSTHHRVLTMDISNAISAALMGHPSAGTSQYDPLSSSAILHDRYVQNTLRAVPLDAASLKTILGELQNAIVRGVQVIREHTGDQRTDSDRKDSIYVGHTGKLT
jgi:hypothetical protein